MSNTNRRATFGLVGVALLVVAVTFGTFGAVMRSKSDCGINDTLGCAMESAVLSANSWLAFAAGVGSLLAAVVFLVAWSGKDVPTPTP